MKLFVCLGIFIVISGLLGKHLYDRYLYDPFIDYVCENAQTFTHDLERKEYNSNVPASYAADKYAYIYEYEKLIIICPSDRDQDCYFVNNQKININYGKRLDKILRDGRWAREAAEKALIIKNTAVSEKTTKELMKDVLKGILTNK